MCPDLQAMQDDESINSRLLWVAQGAALWETPEGAADRSCEGCHGDAAESMAGVAARYPAWDEAVAVPVDLAGRIDLCRTRHQALGTRHQQAEALGRDSDSLLALAPFVARHSDGLPITPKMPIHGSILGARRAMCCSTRAWASSTSPVQAATMTSRAGASLHLRSPGPTPPAILTIYARLDDRKRGQR